ncbi:hypothetical protein [Sporomusa malonica]|uniref:Predicted secreted protein n=1 Tax=Sporomusa malonica TaxID=112901 RepID=A0A1W2CT93_9FIRM|nr:hypothetical protein [Sporomusa malonica]SMC88144.1 Predicted secreted protein [Sporomusa malonica]
MLRQNKLAIVSHCVLNQNSVVQPLARSGGSFHQLVSVLAEAGLGIYQLPCPELIHAGMKRKPQTYEEYNTPAFEAVCRQAADRVLQDLSHLQAVGCDVRLLLGIRRSPTCSLTKNNGHLFRLLLPELIKGFPNMLIMDVPPDYIEGQSHEFESVLRQALQS